MLKMVNNKNAVIVLTILFFFILLYPRHYSMHNNYILYEFVIENCYYIVYITFKNVIEKFVFLY